LRQKEKERRGKEGERGRENQTIFASSFTFSYPSLFPISPLLKIREGIFLSSE
jgi:hypothetical protein